MQNKHKKHNNPSHTRCIHKLPSRNIKDNTMPKVIIGKKDLNPGRR